MLTIFVLDFSTNLPNSQVELFSHWQEDKVCEQTTMLSSSLLR